MKGFVKFAAGFIFGASAGCFGSYIFCKKRYDKRFQDELQKEIDTLRGIYTGKAAKNDIDHEKIAAEEISDDEVEKIFDEIDRKNIENNSIRGEKFKNNRKDYKKYHQIVEDEDYSGSTDDGSAPSNQRKFISDEKRASKPYIFDPDDGYIPENYKSYSHICVYYDPTDYNSCINELGEEMEHVDTDIGYENLDVLKEKIDACEDLRGNPPVIFVRNERLQTEYEITFDGVLFY